MGGISWCRRGMLAGTSKPAPPPPAPTSPVGAPPSSQAPRPDPARGWAGGPGGTTAAAGRREEWRWSAQCDQSLCILYNQLRVCPIIQHLLTKQSYKFPKCIKCILQNHSRVRKIRSFYLSLASPSLLLHRLLVFVCFFNVQWLGGGGGCYFF